MGSPKAWRGVGGGVGGVWEQGCGCGRGRGERPGGVEECRREPWGSLVEVEERRSIAEPGVSDWDRTHDP